MLTSEQFLELIERHLKERGIKASRFGKDVFGDPGFVFELRRGRQPNLASVNKALDFIASAAPVEPEGAAA